MLIERLGMGISDFDACNEAKAVLYELRETK